MTRAPRRPPLTAARLALVSAALALVAALSALAGLLIGATPLDLAAALGDPASVDHTILVDHRLPRVLAGLLTGAVLAASGAALQGLLRNPLADPFILGVSGGGALGAALVALAGTALGLSPLTTGGGLAESAGGFLGALLALVVVTALATRRGRIQPLDMLLVGAIFNAFAGALLLVLQALAEAGAVQRVLLRLMGSLAPDPGQPLILPALAAAALLAAVALATGARPLNLLALGDDTARTLGVHPDRLRLRLFVALSLAIGAVVAATGMIGFVGLIVPHGVRLALGPDHRLMLPASALAGAAFVVLADAGVRALAGPLGTELPVGALTATLGGPTFLWLLRRGQRPLEAT